MKHSSNKFLCSSLLISFLMLSPFSIQASSQLESWNQWKKKRIESFQKKFAPPTITHHTYLKSVDEQVSIDLRARYPRFSQNDCVHCEWSVVRTGLETVALKKKGQQSSMVIEAGKFQQLGSQGLIYVSYNQYKASDPIRVFIHDLGQKHLTKKRMRSFFPYQKKFEVTSIFKLMGKNKVVKIQRSDGSMIERSVIGELRFTISGQKGVLSIYNFSEDGSSYKSQKTTMLLFRDRSSGRSTYGAGRFLNVEFPKAIGQLKDGDQIFLNFNYSYNPPCAVSTGFHCPLPQDIVQSEVLVGERFSPLK